MNKKTLFLLSLLIPFYLFSQIPHGYYDPAVGKQHHELKEALFDIIKESEQQEYDALWDCFSITDAKPNGKVWDIYSDLPDTIPPYEYDFYQDRCGNYSQEGDCYNREHSMPKSWFGGNIYPMYSDLFHIYPTDGWVNGFRDNWAYGEVANPTRTTANGSKRGPCSYPGYSGTAFEPIDEYKGDLARTYFYMSVRYKDKNLGQKTESQFIGSELAPWALAMMIEWHLADPVSEKEINRNNMVHHIQKNRNPFIDYPELVSYLWGDDTLNVFAPYIITQINTLPAKTISLYPNPAHNQCTLQFSSPSTGELILSDMVGTTLFVTKVEQVEQYIIPVSNLKPGVYTLSFIHNLNFKETHKIIIW